MKNLLCWVGLHAWKRTWIIDLPIRVCARCGATRSDK